MSGWWDDFLTLLFKRAVLLQAEGTDVITRYLRFVKHWAVIAARVFGGLLALFIAFLIGGASWPWMYQTLILLMAGVLLAMIFISLPLLCLSETIYNVLPLALRSAVSAWLRRGGAILFGALLTAVFISVFGLWRSPGRMMFALLILATLGVGASIGWWSVSDVWRRAVAKRLLVILLVVAVVSRFPVVAEFGNWVGEQAEASVFRVTRPTPERWQPGSADDLIFVDGGSGRFLVWYYRDAGGNYELYKSKGYHRLGTALRRAESEAEFASIRNWQLARDLEREAALRAQQQEAVRKQEEERKAAAARAAEIAQQQERGRVASAEAAAQLARKQEEDRAAESRRQVERAREADRLRIARYVVALPSPRVNYVVFSLDASRRPWSDLTSALVSRLAHGNDITVAGDVLTDAFASPEGFDTVVAGNGGADLATMRLGDAADRLLLVRGSSPQAGAGSIAGVRTFSMTMTVSLIDTRDGKKLKEFVISDVTGAGVTDIAAKAAFPDRFAEALAQRGELLNRIR